jgi:hypothetical protein
MVPVDYITFFTTMATVGATLFGLIFVVISIRPEITRAETTSVVRQAQAAISYTSLLNPLVISLLALLPHATIDTSTIVMSTIGLVSILTMVYFLFRYARGSLKRLSNVLFILGGLVMFGFELFYAIQLDIDPGDTATLRSLAILLVIIYIYGIARAWDLIGIRQFHLQDVVSPLIAKGKEESSLDASNAAKKDAHSQRD